MKKVKRSSMGCSGFTLLEILIALFVFTIISIILTGVLHTIFDFQKHTAQNAKRLSELQLTFLLMSRDIEQTIKRPSMNAKGITEDAFLGDAHAFTFTHAGFTNPEGLLPRATLQRTHYFLNKNEIIRETWQSLDQTNKSENYSRKLIAVENWQISYLDEKGVFQIKWPPATQQNNALPKAVRVSLTLENWGRISQLFLIPS